VCRSAPVLLVVLLALAGVRPVLADDEVSNVAHVVAGPHGRCYAKSVPAHTYDPEGEPRQQGHTTVYRVGETLDVVEHRFDWFAQKLFISCGVANETVVVRVGPWHRGRDPRADHLAIAFYRGGVLLNRYSTLDIAGDERAEDGELSEYRNVSVSESHYTVFEREPEMVRATSNTGPVFTEHWSVTATTVDGRTLAFDVTTGEPQ